MVAMSLAIISTETPFCIPTHMTQAIQNSLMGFPTLRGHNSSIGAPGQLPLMDTDKHVLVPRNIRVHICWLLMRQFYAKPKPLVKASLRRPKFQTVTFRMILGHTFTKHTEAGGQQEGGNGGRLTAEARKWDLPCAGQTLPSSGCLKNQP